jgi:hypothetical protein
MIAAVETAARIEPQRCRESAERFAPDRIAQAYEAIYFEAIGVTASTASLGVAAPAG